MDIPDDYFFSRFIDTPSDSPNNDTKILMVGATLVHDHNENEILKFMRSMKGRTPALDRNREVGHDQLYKDYFHNNNPTYSPYVF